MGERRGNGETGDGVTGIATPSLWNKIALSNFLGFYPGASAGHFWGNAMYCSL